LNPEIRATQAEQGGLWAIRFSPSLHRNANVDGWLKNDHLGFELLYVFKSVVQKYRPDFIIRLKDSNFLALETKGQDTDQDKAKRAFLDEWVKAVNEHGGFGKWSWAVSKQPGDLVEILKQSI